MKGVVRSMLLAFIGVSVTLPICAHAQVVISEFMYDAPGADSGQEWAELFNAGASAVDLTKWKINDGSNHVLNVPPKNGGVGSVTIAPGGYVILADSASNFEAQYPSVSNVIDATLALPNASGTISLVDDSGATVDSLTYTKDLGGAGDGNSLARSSVSNAALAAGTPTPGTGSLTGQTSDDSSNTASSTPDVGDTSTTTSAQETKTAATPVSSYVPPPAPQLYADAGSDRTVIVGADVKFDGRAYNRNQVPLGEATTRFTWNFGDGSTAEGASVLHNYSYPGRYAVVLSIADDRFSVSDTLHILAEPAELGFSPLGDGGVAIENRAGHDLDLSEWIVRASPGPFSAQFILPEHSTILSGGTMRISSKTLGFVAGQSASLDYPNGVVAVAAGGQIAPQQPANSVTAYLSPISDPPPRAASVATDEATSSAISTDAGAANTIASSTDDTASSTDESLSRATQAPVSPQVAGAAAGFAGGRLWWAAAALLALAGAGTMIAARHFSRREWNVIEEKGE